MKAINKILIIKKIINNTEIILFKKIIDKIFYKPLSNYYNIHIGYNAKIGKNFNIPHNNVIIRDEVIIGDNVSIRQFSTIGTNFKEFHKKGFCKIGNNVQIGCGVSIIGNVIIGDNVFIGANSTITKNIPNNMIVYGINNYKSLEKGSFKEDK